MTTQAYPIGTVAIITSFRRPIYGVVIDRDFWLENAVKDDSDDVNYFLQGEINPGKDRMIPILFLGDVIGRKLVEVDGEMIVEKYVQKYGYSNVGGDIRIIDGGAEELLNIIWHMRQFTRCSVEYIESAFHNIEALKIYLNGGYDLNSDRFTPVYRELIKRYEKALPNLAGQTHCCT